MDLFAAPDKDEIKERREERIRNCKHEDMSKFYMLIPSPDDPKEYISIEAWSECRFCKHKQDTIHFAYNLETLLAVTNQKRNWVYCGKDREK